MIRPFTCVCVLLAAGSGLYLYQVKQRTLMLDRQIDAVLKQTDATRATTTLLRANYAALSQPERLLALSQRFLSLQPTMPTQFVQNSDLDVHLPPVQSFPKPGEAPAPAASAALVADAAAAHDAEQDDLSHLAAVVVPPRPDTSPARVASLESPSPALPAMGHGDRLASAGAMHRDPAAAAHAPQRVFARAVTHEATIRPVAALRPEDGRYAAYAPSYRAPRPRPAAISTGSMLGDQATAAMAPPVPVAN
jgi:hypothetical protein